ncbi:hypothetical protein AB6A40_006987 [Gnathostoma spinigerum]|uniref:Uncharacterized protein n=1 Tax=Gnathostoma spinigerum TaxID=75299 RepID=A0ABD6ETA9_9BILA
MELFIGSLESALRRQTWDTKDIRMNDESIYTPSTVDDSILLIRKSLQKLQTMRWKFDENEYRTGLEKNMGNKVNEKYADHCDYRSTCLTMNYRTCFKEKKIKFAYFEGQNKA